MSNTPTFTIKEMIEAGVHYGHKKMRWNPRMAQYLYGVRNDIHIIDLQQTAPLFFRALQAVRQVTANNGRVLFVGTKRQASEVIETEAKRCGQYFVAHRWLGGMLTNWETVTNSISLLNELDVRLNDESARINKRERLTLTRRRDKLERSLGGIRDMGGLPDIIFVIDTNKEHIAIQEAKKLGIPVVAIVDSNSTPDDIDYIVPGNDDATRAIEFYSRLVADAALAGIQDEIAASGGDVGSDAGELVEKAAAADAKEASA